MKDPKTWLDDLKLIVYFTLLLWVIKSAEGLFALDLRLLAIQPREWIGLLGVIFTPLLHRSWEHLAANSVPLLLLGGLMAYGYPISKWKTLLIVWLVSGAGVWLFARPSYHLGASGLTTGLFYFLLLASIIRRDKVSIGLMFVAVILYGGILLGILPWDPRISFEAHFFGAVGGVLSAVLFRDQDPKPKPKVYEWEEVDSLDEHEAVEYWKIGYSEKDDK